MQPKPATSTSAPAALPQNSSSSTGSEAKCHVAVCFCVLFEVAESVIRSPKDNSSWTGSESECRDSVFVGVLRNETIIPCMSLFWWISAAAEILMVQGFGVTIGAEFESFPRGHDSFPSAEKHMLMVLAMDTREGPDPEDKAEFLMAATGHLLEDLMATYHPPGIPDVVTSGLYDSFGRLHQQCVHDPWRCGSTLASSVFQCIVLAWEAREGPNTQGQAGRFMAETGHHLMHRSCTDGAHRHHDRWIEGAGIPSHSAPHGSNHSEHAVGCAARLHARLHCVPGRQ